MYMCMQVGFTKLIMQRLMATVCSRISFGLLKQ